LDGQIFGDLGHVHPQGNNLPQADVYGGDCQILGCLTLMSTYKVLACISNLSKCKTKITQSALISVGAKIKAAISKIEAQPKANLVILLFEFLVNINVGPSNI
jgi:hypothetical protein